jgi:hypothetical protein
MHNDDAMAGTSNDARNCNDDDGTDNKNASSGGIYDRIDNDEDEDLSYHQK